MTKNNQEFDRSVAFTFYGEWAQDAATIEEDYGLEGIGAFCKAIYEYALNEVEIAEVSKPPIKYFWHTIKEKIDASQEHRSRGFGKENIEQTQQILQYKTNNPSASQNEISQVLGISKGKVNKVLKNNNTTSISTPTITDTITSTSTTMTATVTDTQKKEKEENIKTNSLNDLLLNMNCAQLSEIKEVYECHVPYKEIAIQYNIPYFDGKQFEELYDNIYKERYDTEHPEEAEKRKQREHERREADRIQRENEAKENEIMHRIMENTPKVKPRSLQEPKKESVFAEDSIDGSELDPRLAGQKFPANVRDIIKAGGATMEEFVQMCVESYYDTDVQTEELW